MVDDFARGCYILNQLVDEVRPSTRLRGSGRGRSACPNQRMSGRSGRVDGTFLTSCQDIVSWQRGLKGAAVTTTETSVGLRALRVDAIGGRVPTERYISENSGGSNRIRSGRGLAVGLSGRGPPKPGKLRGVSGRRPVRVGAPRRRRGSAGLPQRVPAPWEPAPFGNRHRPRGHRLPVSPLDLGPAGRPQARPRPRRFPDFDDACFSLNSVRCEIWEGFVFVNLDSKAESLWTISRPSPNGSPPTTSGSTPALAASRCAGGQLEDHRRRVPRRVPPPGCPPPTPQGSR